jgi:hypothetical protein
VAVMYVPAAGRCLRSDGGIVVDRNCRWRGLNSNDENELVGHGVDDIVHADAHSEVGEFHGVAGAV